MRAVVATAALCVVAIGSGCASFAAFKVPQTLPTGDQQILLGTAIDVNSLEETGYQPLPDITLGSRFGVADDTDVGGRIAFMPLGRRVTTMLLEVSARHRLVRDARDGAVNVSVQPSLGYRWLSAGGTDAHIGDFSLPVIAGMWVTSRNQVIVSPQVSLQVGHSTGAYPVWVPAAGGSIGWQFQQTPARGFMVEASALFTPRGTEGTSGTGLFHIGAAILWNRR